MHFSGRPFVLQIYPKSAELLQLLIDMEERSYMTAQLRMKVARISEESVAVPAWLILAKLESSQSHGPHLVKVASPSIGNDSLLCHPLHSLWTPVLLSSKSKTSSAIH